jgi:hypothetical protein
MLLTNPFLDKKKENENIIYPFKKAILTMIFEHDVDKTILRKTRSQDGMCKYRQEYISLIFI